MTTAKKLKVATVTVLILLLVVACIATIRRMIWMKAINLNHITPTNTLQLLERTVNKGANGNPGRYFDEVARLWDRASLSRMTNSISHLKVKEKENNQFYLTVTGEIESFISRDPSTDLGVVAKKQAVRDIAAAAWASGDEICRVKQISANLYQGDSFGRGVYFKTYVSLGPEFCRHWPTYSDQALRDSAANNLNVLYDSASGSTMTEQRIPLQQPGR